MNASRAVHNSGEEANPVKKGWMALLCIVMAGMVLTGCAAGNASGTTATTAPIVTNSPMATSTAQAGAATMTPDMSPDVNMGMAGGMAAGSAASGVNSAANTAGGMNTMTPAQAGRTAERIKEAVERLSEIDDAEVVIDSNSRVAVAVEFDDQYSAGLDDRMKQMIVDAVKKVDDGLTEIEITDDSTLYAQIKSLGERMAKATGLNELASDFGDLWNRITGM